jgi:hypothetical protein
LTRTNGNVDLGASPLPGESLDGFIARRAAAEGLPNTLVITAAAGVRWAHRPVIGLATSDQLLAVAQSMGFDHDELVLRSSPVAPGGRNRRFFGLELDHRHFANSRRRFSPTSLKATPHHRALWGLWPFPFCDESWEMLLDTCPDPECRTIQRWHHAMGIELCDRCVEPLSRAAAPVVPEELRSALRLMIGLVHPDPRRRAESAGRLPECLRHLSPGDLLDLGCALAGVHDPSIRQRSNRRLFADDASAKSVTEAMAAAWAMLERWPNAFAELAGARLATRTGRHGDGNKGATEAFLALADSPSVTAPVRQVVARLRAELCQAHRGLDVKAAAALSGLRIHELTGLRRGLFVKTIFAIHDDRPLPLICKADLERLGTLLRSTSSLGKAAAELGITYRGVEELVRAGRLEAIEEPALAFLARERRVGSASVERLRSAVLARSTPTRPEGSVPLRRAMVGVSGLKPWARVLEAIADGRLQAFTGAATVAPLIDRISVRPDAVMRLCKDRAATAAGPDIFSDMMSKKEALEALGLHHRHGACILSEWPVRTGSDRTIPVAAVEALASTAISPAEAAARFGGTSLAMARLLQRRCVPSIPGGLFDRGRAEETLRAGGDLRSGEEHAGGNRSSH